MRVGHSTQNSPQSRTSAKHVVDRTRTENVIEEAFATSCISDWRQRNSQVHSATASAWRESCTRLRPRAVADGSLESERVAVDEAPAHDGVEGMMERIDGRGSNARPNFRRSQPARSCPFSYWLTFSTYISYGPPHACAFLLAFVNTYRSVGLASYRKSP